LAARMQVLMAKQKRRCRGTPRHPSTKAEADCVRSPTIPPITVVPATAAQC
jgi:hypothetical protein